MFILLILLSCFYFTKVSIEMFVQLMSILTMVYELWGYLCQQNPISDYICMFFITMMYVLWGYECQYNPSQPVDHKEEEGSEGQDPSKPALHPAGYLYSYMTRFQLAVPLLSQNVPKNHCKSHVKTKKHYRSFTLHQHYIVQGVPKKRTFRMLLEPQCTGSITSSRHPLCLEIDYLVVSY